MTSADDHRRSGAARAEVRQQFVADGGIGIKVVLGAAERPARSTVPNIGHAPFVGRDATLARLAQLFDGPPGRLVVLHGPPGVGKSWLALHWARLQAERYPGGTFYVDLAGQTGVPVDLARLARTVLGASHIDQLSLEDQCRSVLARFGPQRTLLVYDQVRDEPALVPWLPPAGLPCDVIASSNFEAWSPRFCRVPLDILPDDEALALVRALVSPAVFEALGPALVRAAGGLPVQLAPIAIAVDKQVQRGREGQVRRALAEPTRKSFSTVWEALPADARLALKAAALFDPQRIPAAALTELLRGPGGLSGEGAIEALDAAMDFSVMHAHGNELRIHELFSAFLDGEQSGAPALSEALLEAHLERFMTTVRLVLEQPGSEAALGQLLEFRLTMDRWMAHPSWRDAARQEGLHVAVALRNAGRFADALTWALPPDPAPAGAEVRDPAELSVMRCFVGECLAGQGRHAEAEAWFRQALDEARMAEIGTGLADNPGLVGTCLHHVGFSLTRRGLHAEALPWFERAVAAHRGNARPSPGGELDLAVSVHEVGVCLLELLRYQAALPWLQQALELEERAMADRPRDHEVLGKSYHAIGVCHREEGRHEEAAIWFKRAVEAKRRGDRNGRVDHDSVGRTLHGLAACFTLRGLHEPALPWLEEAVAHAREGDVYGRVDHATIARSLYTLAEALKGLGRYQQGFACYQESAAEHAKGDVHGNVHYPAMGKSLHMMGICLAHLRDFLGALAWLEKALEAKRTPDALGRIDHESVSWTLYAIGSCHAELGRDRRAQPWFERALREARQGDVHGRINDVSLRTNLGCLAACLARQGRPGPRSRHG